MCYRGVNKCPVVCMIFYPLLWKTNWERFQNPSSTFNSLRNAHNVSRNDEDFVHFAHLLSQNNLDSAFRPYYTDSEDIITRIRITLWRRCYQVVPLPLIVMNTGEFGRYVRLFRKNLLPPSSGQNSDWSVTLLYLKMETAGLSETLMDIYQTIRCHIPKDRNLFLYSYYVTSVTNGSQAVLHNIVSSPLFSPLLRLWPASYATMRL